MIKDTNTRVQITMNKNLVTIIDKSRNSTRSEFINTAVLVFLLLITARNTKS